jgi:hypothetical protein
MPPVPVDPVAVRAALERQLALLTMIVEHLNVAAVAPSPILSAEWRGPSAEQAELLVTELRRRLRDAAGVTDDSVRRVRLQIATLL